MLRLEFHILFPTCPLDMPWKEGMHISISLAKQYVEECISLNTRKEQEFPALKSTKI